MSLYVEWMRVTGRPRVGGLGQGEHLGVAIQPDHAAARPQPLGQRPGVPPAPAVPSMTTPPSEGASASRTSSSRTGRWTARGEGSSAGKGGSRLQEPGTWRVRGLTLPARPILSSSAGEGRAHPRIIGAGAAPAS